MYYAKVLEYGPSLREDEIVPGVLLNSVQKNMCRARIPKISRRPLIITRFCPSFLKFLQGTHPSTPGPILFSKYIIIDFWNALLVHCFYQHFAMTRERDGLRKKYTCMMEKSYSTGCTN